MKSMEQWVVHRISSKKCKSCCENFDFLTKKKFRRKLGIFRMLFACEKCTFFRFFAKFRFYLLRERMRKFREKTNANVSGGKCKNFVKKLNKRNY